MQWKYMMSLEIVKCVTYQKLYHIPLLTLFVWVLLRNLGSGNVIPVAGKEVSAI